MNDQDMNPDEKNKNDDKLKQLLRASMSSEMENPPMPDEIAIRAYINGNATAEQKNLVRDAMMFSKSFAEEMLNRLEAQQDLVDPELAARMANVEVPLEELLSRSNSRQSHGRVVQGGSSVSMWDKIREFVWQPALGYGVAAVFLALMFIPRAGDGPGGEPGVGIISMNEYRVTRSVGDSGSYTQVMIDTDGEFVDLLVKSQFDPARNISFETTLYKTGESVPLLFIATNQRYQIVDSNIAYPVLRVDAGFMVPGRYMLRFLPVLADGNRLENGVIEGRFEILE